MENVRYLLIEDVATSQTLSWLEDLCKAILGYVDMQTLSNRLQFCEKRLAVIALSENNEPVGFKLGYSTDDKEFYSWLGGVCKKYRRQGIAMTLMRLQHQWCKEQGFKLVSTRTKNDYRGMLILNIREGFNIVGTSINTKGGLKIWLEKRLE